MSQELSILQAAVSAQRLVGESQDQPERCYSKEEFVQEQGVEGVGSHVVGGAYQILKISSEVVVWFL